MQNLKGAEKKEKEPTEKHRSFIPSSSLIKRRQNTMPNI